MKKLILLTMILLSAQLMFSQTFAEFKEKWDAALEKTRQDKYNGGAHAYNNFFKVIPNEIIDEVLKHEKDTLSRVRDFVYKVLDKTATKNTDTSIRQKCVYRLVFACNDKDKTLRERFAHYLEDYKAEDFSQQSKDKLVSYLSLGKDKYYNIVKIVAFVGLTDQLSAIQNLLNNDTTITSDKERWQLRLALARLGDENQIASCTDFARSRKVNDRVIEYLLRDIVYIRQKEPVDYLIEILQSEDKNCRPPNADSTTPIVCGYRIMELLAPAVVDFPLIYNEDTQELEAEDYEAALQTVRLWFLHNPDYKIRKDNY